MATWPQIQAGIFAGESGGDYNTLFGNAQRPGGPFAGTNLTNMTVNQVAQFTDPNGPYAQWVKSKIGRVATPTGAYQVVGTTLRNAAKDMGLTGNEVYSPELQDKIGQHILKTQGTSAWAGYKGPRTPSPYAGLPDGPKGQEVYAKPGLAPATDPVQTAGILGGFFNGTPQEAQAVSSILSADENAKSPLQKFSEALIKYPDAPAVRFGPMGDARQSGSDLLKQLQKLRG